MNILFGGKAFLRLWDVLSPAFQEHSLDVAEDEEIPSKLPWADIFVIRPMTIDKDILKYGAKLKLVQQWGVGVEGLNVEDCTEAGVYACNIPSRGTGNAEGVAEIAILHMMLLARRYHRAKEKLQEGKVFTPPGVTLWGKRACVIGLGNLGHCVVERLKGLGMSVTGVNRTYREEFSQWGVDTFYSLAEMEKALAGCRFVILALALTPETYHSIAEPFFQSIDRDAFFINVARGDIVVREAFDKALQNKWIAGAGFDVFWKEPPEITDPILNHPLVTTTPHIGGVTDASLNGAIDFIVKNVQRVALGEEPYSCLNSRDLQRKKTL
ncbi:MAG: 2-hydroxyacid dehydrogenase [Aminobacterium sp.]|jgi:phosphoglycerate dehydrogenase-like enzyme|nr:2-hydroxyacid dehydrogenase [Aminobacterium sp.]MDD4227994.1 2-hydroxyacid dehydrogenase [Aminobacterium sp.]